MSLPVSRMFRFTLGSALVYGVGRLVAYASPQSIFSILELIGGVGLVAALFYYGFRLLGWARARLLWKVRNKLIVSFAFVGIIPVALLVLIAWTSMTLIFKQLSVLVLEHELTSVSGSLRQTGRDVVNAYYRREGKTPADLKEEAFRIWADHRGESSSLSLLIYGRGLDEAGPGPYRLTASVPSDSGGETPLGSVLPHWVSQAGIHGLVLEKEQVRFESTLAVSEQLMLSVRQPLDQDMLRRLETSTSTDLTLTASNPSGDEFQLAYSSFFGGRSSFSIGFVHFVTPVAWEEGRARPEDTQAFLLSIPVWTLLDNLFRQTAGPGGRLVLVILVGLVAAFLVVEAASLLVGTAIALTLTRSIGHIYEGTLKLRQGEFGYRIPSRSKDQLDAVADSFNEMSSNIVRLMSEVSAQEWIAREIEIARDVQAQLFPQRLPHITRLETAATCLPAREVSGDYYDFISLDRERLDVVVGDISGKGIAAALLMASLQSTIRSQLLVSGLQQGRMAAAVGQVNHQVFRQTSPEKYSTLVLAHFDMAAATLTFCNAGHNPPLLLSREQVRRLETGGTVVGLFEQPPYEESSVGLAAGDLLVFYTDGVIEAENDLGEQFGEERLIRTLRGNEFLTAEDLLAAVLDELSSWLGGREAADDITVLVFKILPA